MKSFSNIDFSKLSLFDSIITILQFIRKDFPVENVLSDLKNKIKEAEFYFFSEKKPTTKLKNLLDLFYKNWNFESASGVYQLSDVIWIDHVLKTRKGTAVSLGIIFLHIAQSLKLPVYPVIFPTQLILRADWTDEKKWLIDPFNGDILNEDLLRAWIKGNISPIAKLYPKDLYSCDSISVIQKMLEILKSALIEEKNMELALNVSNILVQLNPNNPYEIRDRGLLYARLQCTHIAIKDLIYFIQNCPDDPISEIIKAQIYAMQQQKIVFH